MIAVKRDAGDDNEAEFLSGAKRQSENLEKNHEILIISDTFTA